VSRVSGKIHRKKLEEHKLKAEELEASARSEVDNPFLVHQAMLAQLQPEKN